MAALVGVGQHRPNRSRGARAALITAACVALATACTPIQGGAPTPVSDASPTVAAVLSEGGIVRLPITEIPTQLNPWSSAGRDTNAATLRGPLTTPAFTYDAAGVPSANPDLVAHVTVTGSGAQAGPTSGATCGTAPPTASSSPCPTPSSASTSASATDGPTVVTLTLNPDAVWADGSPITAADWIATFRALHSDRYQISDRQGWDRVESVRKGATDHTVIVTFDGPEPDWTQPLAEGPARAEAVASAAAFNGWTIERSSWLAGPFVVADIDRTRGVLTLRQNPHWWGAKPILDTIFVRRVSSDALAATVAAGEFDLYSPNGSSVQLAKARTAPDSGVRSVPGTSGRELRMGSGGVLGDRAVRQAIVQGLDRSALADAALSDGGESVTVWSNPLFLPQQQGYVDIAEATGLEYDPDAADTALTKAGYSLVGQERRGPAGALHLTITVPEHDRRAAAEAAQLRSNLTALGIGSTEVTAGGDLTVVDLAVSRYPMRALSSRVAGVPGAAAVVAGSDEQTDAGLRQGQATRAARMIWQDAHILPLYVEPQTWVVRAGLTNAGPPGYASITWAGVGYAR